jgi:hypothetical protein
MEGVTLSTGKANTSTGSYFVDEVQALTGASTATEVNNYGVTYIKSTGSGGAGAKVFKIAAPVVGQHKYLFVRVASTKAVSVRTLTSDAVFLLGTTKNSISFSTGSTMVAGSAHLVGLSSVLWGVIGGGSPFNLTTAAANAKVLILGATA